MNNEIWTAEKVIEIQKLIAKMDVASLDYMITDENGEEIGSQYNLIIDDSPGPQEILEQKELLNLLLKYVNKLKPRECLIIKLRYGLEDGKFRTLEQVGEMFSVTRERIRQIEERALEKLKKLLWEKEKFRSINDI